MKDPEKNPALSPQQLKQIMAAPEMRQLLQLLQKDGGAALQQAAQQFRAGNTEAAQETLRPLMQDRETEQLLNKLNSRGR